MATPRAAVHRDVEQRFRDLEAAVRELTGAALRRSQLGVASGDFVVAGGGGIVIRDGGLFRVDYPPEFDAATSSLVLGPYTGADDKTAGYELVLWRPDGFQAFGATVILPGAAYPQGYSTLNAEVNSLQFSARDGLSLAGGGSGGGALSLSDTVTVLTGGPSGLTITNGTGAARTAPVTVSCGVMRVEAPITVAGNVDSTGTLFARGYNTTSAAANAFLATGGQLFRVSSSRRFKRDIADAAVEPDRVLQLRGRTWRDRGEVEDDPATDRRHVGFIAEEVHDAGLGEFVEYDEAGVPLSIQYDRLSVAMLAVLKRQESQLGDLTRRLEALEAAA